MGNTVCEQVTAEKVEKGHSRPLLSKYPDERSCERMLIEARWADGWECPACGNRSCSPVANRNRIWQCTKCSRQFSVTAGTAMQGSKVELKKWFHAIWLIAKPEIGISAMRLARQVGVSENTARYMMKRVRGGIVRADYAQHA